MPSARFHRAAELAIGLHDGACGAGAQAPPGQRFVLLLRPFFGSLAKLRHWPMGNAAPMARRLKVSLGNARCSVVGRTAGVNIQPQSCAIPPTAGESL